VASAAAAFSSREAAAKAAATFAGDSPWAVNSIGISSARLRVSLSCWL
jgi:hypothetical protein